MFIHKSKFVLAVIQKQENQSSLLLFDQLIPKGLTQQLYTCIYKSVLYLDYIGSTKQRSYLLHLPSCVPAYIGLHTLYSDILHVYSMCTCIHRFYIIFRDNTQNRTIGRNNTSTFEHRKKYFCVLQNDLPLSIKLDSCLYIYVLSQF